MADFSGPDLDHMLTEARRTLASMRSGAAPDPEDLPDVEGVGEAADGYVKVTAEPGGRLKAVQLNPRAMRMASEELGEHLVAAANAALADLRAKSADAGAAEAVDTAALSQQVEQVQNEGMRQMAAISQAVSDAISKIGGSR